MLEGGKVRGIALMREGLAMMRGTGTETCLTRLLARVAHACIEMEELGEAGGAVAEGMEFVERFDERYMEAELTRLKGELHLLQSGDEPGAEQCFIRALEVARRQGARAWELRAAMSLSRLWWTEARQEEARQLLGQILAWFTEGFSSADLKDARTLLETMNDK